MGHDDDNYGNLPLNRIESFSDGVISIIITILVLGFEIPELRGSEDIHDKLRRTLVLEIPKLLSYIVSFFVLSVWWVAHHQLLHMLRRADRAVLWLNTVFLMFLALIPFPTGLLGKYPNQSLPAILYGLVCCFTGISFLILRSYIGKKRNLIKSGVTDEELRHALIRGRLNPVLYASSTGVAIQWPFLSILLYVLISVYYVFPFRPQKKS